MPDPRFGARRLAANVAIAVLVASVTAAGVAFANSTGSHPSNKDAVSSAVNRSPSAVADAARSALDRLVADGTIDQAQANRVERQVVAGSIDPAALIAAGTVTPAQMRAVDGALVRVKESMAGAVGTRAARTKVRAPDGSNQAPVVIQRRARTVLERLVANGTISQAGADAIERQVVAGSVDADALIAAGTVNQAQMRAVANALGQVKRSFAASQR